MRKSPRLHRCVAVYALVLAFLSVPAVAGRTCDGRTPGVVETQSALTLAATTRDALERSDARVAVVARIGSDQSARGLRYTHVGFAQREHPAGRWTVTHALNMCADATSALFDEGLGNFYLDEMYAFETRAVIPAPEAQARLQAILAGPVKTALFEREYSVIANPWSTRYQNSNGWVVEILAAGYAPPGSVRTRAEAQAWLRTQGFTPSRIRITPTERASTRLFAANVRYGDHPDEAWQRWEYEVVSADAILAFVLARDPDARALNVKVERGTAVATYDPPRRMPAARSADLASTRGTEPARNVAPVPAAEPRRSVAVAPAAVAAPAAPDSPPSERARVLGASQGLIASYACRDAGYLRQCFGVTADQCELLVRDAVQSCFAPVSDGELTGASESDALKTVERVGYCAVERTERGLPAVLRKNVAPNGRACVDARKWNAAKL